MSIQSQCPKSCVAIDTTLLTTLSHRISSYLSSYLQRQLLPNTHTHLTLAFLTWPRYRTPTTDPIRCLLLCHWRKELPQRPQSHVSNNCLTNAQYYYYCCWKKSSITVHLWMRCKKVTPSSCNTPGTGENITTGCFGILRKKEKRAIELTLWLSANWIISV